MSVHKLLWALNTSTNLTSWLGEVGRLMQHTASNGSLSHGVSTWLSASAANSRQITGTSFLSHVAATNGIAACTRAHPCSLGARVQPSNSLKHSRTTPGASSAHSGGVLPFLCDSLCPSTQHQLPRHDQQQTRVASRARWCQPSPAVACQAAAHVPPLSSTPGHALSGNLPIRLHGMQPSCPATLTWPAGCRHAVTRHRSFSSRQMMVSAAANTDGYAGLAADGDIDTSFGSYSWTRADEWRSRRPNEWTLEQKLQVLHEKVTDRWNQDPADCGVIFEPTWCGQPQRGPTVICPQCGNGASGNPDFSVTVSDDAVLWHCFRAKCGFEGGVNLVGGLNGNSSAVLDKAGKVLDRLTSSPNTPPTVVAQARHDLQQLRLQVDYKPVPGSLAGGMRPLDQATVDWFQQERKISADTLRYNGVMLEDRYSVAARRIMPHIAFPYYKNGHIVNVKYRAVGEKQFTQSKGGEQILYGYDHAKGVEDLIIVEGEIDKLAIDEALQLHTGNPLWPRSVAVVSVPAGAPTPGSVNMEGKFRYVESCSDLLSSVSRVYLAVDADGPGVLLAGELARRIGREKCWMIDWPSGPADSLAPGALEAARELEAAASAGQPPPFDASDWARKDANEVLIKDNAQVLVNYLKAAEGLHIKGLKTFDEFWQQVWDLYQQGPAGLSWGVSTGWESVDTCYQVVPGELTIVTGLPNSGKSEWLDALAVNLARLHGWKFGVCSMENAQVDHGRKLIEKYTGKAFLDATYSIGTARMSLSEVIDAILWVDHHFHIISRPSDTAPTIDYVLEKARAAVLRYAIKGLIIDPYNELDHRRTGSISETEHVSRMLTKIKRFAQHNDCHVWFVAHPRTQRGLGVGGGTASLTAPSMYDISGSANFINKADNGIVVHRPYSAAQGQGDPCMVQLLVRKVRNKLAGKIGDVELHYDRATGRYMDSGQRG